MLIRDLRYTIRSLQRAPGFALVVMLTLGLGIGVNTAIFSVVRGVLLRPLPHRDGDRLIYLRHSMEGAGGQNILFSVPEINDLREASRTLDGIAECSQMTYSFHGRGDPVRLTVGLVTGNFFRVMGLSPVLGRVLNEADDGTGVPAVMVLTYDYWIRHLGGDSSLIGKPVRVNGKPVTIVGVVQPAPYFPNRMDALLNMVISEHHSSAMMVHGRTHRMTEMVGRLAPGATLAQATTEIAAIRTRVHRDHPDAYDPASGIRVTLIPLREVLGERARLTVWLLMGAAGFVMVIACANVVNLTLMRLLRREHEMVVRSVLGAGTGRLRWLLLAENLVLAALGAVLGVALAKAGVRLLITFAERYSTRASEIRLDGMVLGFTLLLALAAALILSFGPRLAREGTLGTWLASGAHRASGTLRRQRLQRCLAVAQIAVSVVLLCGAGLLTRTMLEIAKVNTGVMGEDRVLTMELPLDGAGRSEADETALFERMRAELRAMPGVKEVGVGSTMPLRRVGVQLDLKVEGRALAAGEPGARAEYRTASPEYFRAAGIPLLNGREFTSTDRAGAAPVVILNQTLAKKLFPDREPIGQRVAWTGDVLRFIGVGSEWRTVVGVVGDTKDEGLDAEPLPVVFQPLAQESGLPGGGLVIRAERDPALLVAAATRVIRRLAPDEPVENVLTVAQIREESVAPRRLNATLLSSFSLLAVIIAAVGIAGVLAFSVSARTNEIGIRMSLGADGPRVRRMVLWEGGGLVALGLLLGIGATLVATRLARGLLFGVTPHDPVTLAGVALVMTAVGIAACWVPAARAAKVDPLVAMRRI